MEGSEMDEKKWCELSISKNYKAVERDSILTTTANEFENLRRLFSQNNTPSLLAFRKKNIQRPTKFFRSYVQ
jgi:hypothetical protein